MRLAVLSPHRDDVAFSCALWLSAAARAGSHSMLITCFTRSNYAPFLPAQVTEERTPEVISALREHEDERFLQAMRLPIHAIDLRCDDAPLRLGVAADQVCGYELPRERYEAEVVALASALARLPRADAALIPFALGAHIDHRIVHDAALRAFAGLPLAFYEDLPYASRMDGAEIAACAAEVGRANSIALRPQITRRLGAAEWKTELARIYDSQIDLATAADIGRFSLRYGEGERIWTEKDWPLFFTK